MQQSKWTRVGGQLKMMIRTDECLGARPQGCVVGPDPGLHLSHSDFIAAPKVVTLLQFCLSLFSGLQKWLVRFFQNVNMNETHVLPIAHR